MAKLVQISVFLSLSFKTNARTRQDVHNSKHKMKVPRIGALNGLYLYCVFLVFKLLKARLQNKSAFTARWLL